MDIPLSPSTEGDSSPKPAEVEEQPTLTAARGLAGVLFRPRATFETMRNARRTHWWLVFVLMVAATALLTYANTHARTSMFAGMTLPEGFTPSTGTEAPQAAGQPSAGAASSAISTLLPVVTGAVGAFASYLICAVLIFGMGLVMGGKATFKQLLPVAVWSTLPLVVRNIVQATASLVTGKMSVAGFSGVFTMTERASMSLLYTLLEQFDVYLIWSLLLLGIGIAVTSKLKGSKTIVIVLTYLALTVGLLLASNALSSALSGLLGTNMGGGMPGMMGIGPRG